MSSGFFKKYIMTSGLTPVFKIETCKSLENGRIGDKTIEDTFPSWVRVADPDRGIGSLLSLSAIRAKVTDFLGSQTTDTPLLGLMIDTAVLNRYRVIANLIFQNVLVNRPTGNQWLSEDLIECGYPIRVSMGFLTPEGHFIQHPYEKALTAGKIYPIFTGIVAAMTQEIVSTGDRFQITCYGFEYLLSQARCLSFTATKGEHLRDVFARLLRQFAQMADHFVNEEEAIKTFGPLATKESPKWPVPILRAMGIIAGKTDKVSAKSVIRRNIRLLNCDRAPRLLQDFDTANLKKKKGGSSYFDVIKAMSPRPPSTLDEQLKVALGDTLKNFYSRHLFFFDYQGRATIMGQFMSTTEIAAGTKRPTHDRDRVRVHDAVIGSNVIHLQMNTTLDMSAGAIDLYYLDPSPGVGPPSFTPASSEHTPSFSVSGQLETDAMRYYGPGSHWGRHDIFLFDQGDTATSVEDLDEILEMIGNRFKHLGMRGSSYMAANVKMQVGDVLRVVDIRDKEGFGTSVGATIDLGVEAATKIKSAIVKRFPSLDKDKRLLGKTVNLGLKGVEDIYWIWKVRHYVGQNEITSKAFFVKEPQTLITTTDAYRRHQIQRKKGVGSAIGDD